MGNTLSSHTKKKQKGSALGKHKGGGPGYGGPDYGDSSYGTSESSSSGSGSSYGSGSGSSYGSSSSGSSGSSGSSRRRNGSYGESDDSSSSSSGRGFFASAGDTIKKAVKGITTSTSDSSSNDSGSSDSSGSSGSSESRSSESRRTSDQRRRSGDGDNIFQSAYKGLQNITSMKGPIFGSSSDRTSSRSQKSENAFTAPFESGKSFVNSAFNVLQGNTIFERIVFVILVLICFIILLSIGSNLLSAVFEPNHPFLVDGLYTASNGKVISQDPTKKDSVPISRSDNETFGIEFSYSIWVNVTSLDDSPGSTGQYKHIFSKGDNDNVPVDSRGLNSPNNSPGLYIDKNTNALMVIMNTFEQLEEMVTVANIPINKWVHVLIRVQGTYLDVYINGTLAKRKVLGSVPKQNNGNIYVCQNGGFSGYISNLRYFKKALEPGDILGLVNKGPSLKMSSLEKKDLKKNNSNYLAMDWYFENAQ